MINKSDQTILFWSKLVQWYDNAPYLVSPSATLGSGPVAGREIADGGREGGIFVLAVVPTGVMLGIAGEPTGGMLLFAGVPTGGMLLLAGVPTGVEVAIGRPAAGSTWWVALESKGLLRFPRLCPSPPDSGTSDSLSRKLTNSSENDWKPKQKNIRSSMM